VDLGEPVLNGQRIKSSNGEVMQASLALFRALAGPASSTGSTTRAQLAGEPCRMCGGLEHLYFSSLQMGSEAFPFEALVCRTCRYAHLFNIETPLEAAGPHQVMKATPKGYR